MSPFLDGGHGRLYGRHEAGLSMVWQRAVEDEARSPSDHRWALTLLAPALICALAMVLSRDPLALRLPPL
jgi:hypothetical protein